MKKNNYNTQTSDSLRNAVYEGFCRLCLDIANDGYDDSDSEKWYREINPQSIDVRGIIEDVMNAYAKHDELIYDDIPDLLRNSVEGLPKAKQTARLGNDRYGIAVNIAGDISITLAVGDAVSTFVLGDDEEWDTEEEDEYPYCESDDAPEDADEAEDAEECDEAGADAWIEEAEPDNPAQEDSDDAVTDIADSGQRDETKFDKYVEEAIRKLKENKKR